MTGTKRCSVCGKEKSVIAFACDRKMKDGLRSNCRECHVEANRGGAG